MHTISMTLRTTRLLTGAVVVLALGLATSPTAGASDRGIGAPSAVRGTHAAVNGRSAVLSWTPPVSDGGASITKYVAASRPAGASCVTVVTSCVLAGLKVATPYTFTVTASNRTGTGPSSAPSNWITLAAVGSPINAVPTSSASHTVTFNANGGAGTMRAETESVTSALTLNGFERPGYNFTYWSVKANGSGTDYLNGSRCAFAASLTLYAQWVVAGNGTTTPTTTTTTPTTPAPTTTTTTPISYTITFNANGGGGSMVSESSSIAETISANIFTRTGHTFTGWNTQAGGTGTGYANGARYGFTASITLYAQWSASGQGPVITLQPSSVALASGSNAVFNAAASGSPAPSVQWESSTNAGANWSVIGGAASTTYSVPAAWSVNGYEYRAVFSNTAGVATTQSATLTFLETSSNWSGYVDYGSTFSAVSGQWTVPTVTCGTSSDAQSAQWVGIDGEGSSTVEQAGTSTGCSNGTPTYGAWYEMYGDAAVNGGYAVDLATSRYPVAPGDVVRASVSLSGSTWSLVVTDETAGWSSSTSIADPSPAPEQTSAEWIVESPDVCTSSCSQSSLASTTSVTFANASATANGVTGSISSTPNFGIELGSGPSNVSLLPGLLSPDGTSFTDSPE